MSPPRRRSRLFAGLLICFGVATLLLGGEMLASSATRMSDHANPAAGAFLAVVGPLAIVWARLSQTRR